MLTVLTRAVARPRPARRRTGLFTRFVLLAAAALLIYAAIPALVTLQTTWQRHAEHVRPVHRDGSVATIDATRQLPADAVMLRLRTADGGLAQVAASRGATEDFLAERLAYLRDERARIAAKATRDLERTFALAFADRDASIATYADWFFAWERSYVVLERSLTAGFSRLVQIGDYEPLATAVERDVKDYFLRHYTEQVLRPDFRDRLIAQGFEDAAAAARESFARVVANQSLAFQLFLAENTTHLSPRSAESLTTVTLDWDAQRWKAPTHMMEDRGFDALVGLTRAGAGGTLGAVLLGPALEASLARAFGGLAARFTSRFAARLAFAKGGAAAGTVAAPGGGTIAGAAIGLAIGFGADYVLNAAQAKIERPDFVAANQAALDATIATWQDVLEGSLDGALEAWFADAEAALVLAPGN